MVYVAFWVGVPCASLLLGDFWRLLSPWRAIGRGTGWLAARVGGEALPAPLAYPERLGRWPAAAGVLAFGICELCWATAREPAPLAVLMLVYVVAMLVGMSLYGVEAWTRNADAFGVYFGLFAALAPLARRDGVLFARPPVVGATEIDGRIAGTAAVLLTGIGVTAFDGASEGPLFNDAAAAPAGPLRRPRLRAAARARARLHDRAVRDRRRRRADLGARPGAAGAGALARADPRGLRRRALLLARSPTTARTWRGSRRTRSGTARTCSAAPTR